MFLKLTMIGNGGSEGRIELTGSPLWVLTATFEAALGVGIGVR
jgi:hypothetical protein